MNNIIYQLFILFAVVSLPFITAQPTPPYLTTGNGNIAYGVGTGCNVDYYVGGVGDSSTFTSTNPLMSAKVIKSPAVYRLSFVLPFGTTTPQITVNTSTIYSLTSFTCRKVTDDIKVTKYPLVYSATFREATFSFNMNLNSSYYIPNDFGESTCTVNSPKTTYTCACSPKLLTKAVFCTIVPIYLAGNPYKEKIALTVSFTRLPAYTQSFNFNPFVPQDGADPMIVTSMYPAFAPTIQQGENAFVSFTTTTINTGSFVYINSLEPNYSLFNYPIYGNPRNATMFSGMTVTDDKDFEVFTLDRPLQGKKPFSLIVNTINSLTVIDFKTIKGPVDGALYVLQSNTLEKPSGISIRMESKQIEATGDNVAPHYPFGLSRSSKLPDGQWSFDFALPIPSYIKSSNITFFNGYQQQSTYTNASAVSTDTTAPTIQKIEFIPLEGYDFLIRIEASDNLSGIMSIRVGGYVSMTTADLVSGNPRQGTYMAILHSCVIAPQELYPDISILDSIGNLALFPSGTPYNSKADLVPYFIPKFQFYPSQITYFQFANNNQDVTKGPASNTLYFKLSNMDLLAKPSILLPPNNLKDLCSKSEGYFQGAYDPYTEMYKIDFTIPRGLFAGPIDYFLGGVTPIYPHMLGSFLGPNAYLNVTNSDADLHPPYITSIVAKLPQQYAKEIGWTITIEDHSNGLKYAYINVTSNLDGQVYPFTIDVSSTLPIKSTHYISIPITLETCRNQIFSISSIKLYDGSNFFSGYPVVEVIPTSIYIYETPSALGDLLYNTKLRSEMSINVNMCKGPLSRPPTVAGFTVSRGIVDVGSSDRQVTFSLTINDTMGGTPRITPTIYLWAFPGQYYHVETNLVSTSGPLLKYSATGVIPYGFGGQKSSIALSISGITNIYQDLVTCSTSCLMSMSLPSTINGSFVTAAALPLITSASPVSADGGLLTLYGSGFSDIPLEINYNDGVGFIGINDALPRYGILLVVRLPRTTSPTIQVRLSKGVVTSNIYTVTLTPSTLRSCPGEGNVCSGHGTCTQLGCQCFPEYTGPDCSTETLVVPKPSQNETDPTTVIDIPDESYALRSIIMIQSVHELTFDGTRLVTYEIDQWMVKNMSTPNATVFYYAALLNDFSHLVESTRDPCYPKKTSKLALIIGVVVGGATLVITMAILGFLLHKRRVEAKRRKAKMQEMSIHL
eukprot:gene17452-20825_t